VDHVRGYGVDVEMGCNMDMGGIADVCGYGVVSGYGVATISRIDQFKVSFGHEPLHKGSFAKKSLRLIESTDRSQFYKGFCMWRI